MRAAIANTFPPPPEGLIRAAELSMRGEAAARWQQLSMRGEAAARWQQLAAVGQASQTNLMLATAGRCQQPLIAAGYTMELTARWPPLTTTRGTEAAVCCAFT